MESSFPETLGFQVLNCDGKPVFGLKQPIVAALKPDEFLEILNKSPDQGLLFSRPIVFPNGGQHVLLIGKSLQSEHGQCIGTVCHVKFNPLQPNFFDRGCWKKWHYQLATF